LNWYFLCYKDIDAYKKEKERRKKIMRKLIPLLLFMGVFAIAFAAGTGGISGIVTDSVTGAPIIGAHVGVMHGGFAITNENGEYLIENLMPGSYQVSAMAQGYSPKHYPEPVAVVEGQTTPNINFALVAFVPPVTGSISGVVTDSVTGNPIAHAMVMVHAPRSHHGSHGRAPGVAFTDSSGAYLINNLLPGNYQVEANVRGYIRKIYPDSVTVVGDQNTPNIDFSLAAYVPPQPGSISGIVIDSITGAPIAGAMVSAMEAGRHHMPGGHAITNADGIYTIENLMPGEYRVIANAQGYEHKVYPDPVVVQEGLNTPDINFALTPGTQNLKINPQIKLKTSNTKPSRVER
jgi:large repetitive protein